MLLKIFSKIIAYAQNLRYKSFRKKYNIHKTFRFNGNDIFFYGDGDINIDKDSYIGSLSTIGASKGYRVDIGKGCSISHNVRIYTSSKSPDWDFSDRPNNPIIYANVIIQDYAWIGANVFINPGITIGKNSVIGANSVVTKDTIENGIYGGVPAKLIRMKNLKK